MVFGWLLGSAFSRRKARLPAGEAVYAVGDIHGRFDLLQDILQRISSDARQYPRDSARTLIFLGDYIDRGPESRSVVEALLDDPLPGFATVRLLGNHEEAFLAFLDGRSDGRDWLAFGGLETLMSYGVPLRGAPQNSDVMASLRLSLISCVPGRHTNLLRSCKLYHRTGDYIFVHAGVRPGVPLEQQNATDMLWIRDTFLNSRNPLPEYTVVHGHTICDRPQDRRGRINIDTGAFASGRLTCLVLRESDRRFISTAD
ncbi:serine/threonine protein phosphatase 1 [Enhydrobacter aerosaccus]|uniref:Serine/threonine protein phosphatase 1 n=1 Tax=Enhydrobacter aerosaccus TaxID=225324 RepID=A0A1T4TA37_9HYPH|nr:metallophosphoesterase family protein [Enhydrobacter aerosaccus]SKA37256.1 serine/threonine protein phosphatase 1 [Enhydrobacter aerosaccus]